MSKKIFLAFIFSIFIFQVSALASQKTLQPGNVYEFAGTDSRLISHVNVSGTGRYQIVLRNADGDVTRFGFAAGRFSVSGTGAAEISPLVPITVSYDASRFRITEKSGSALRLIELAEGETVLLESAENLHVRTNTASDFDFSVTNRSGNVTTFGRNVRLPQLSIPTNGALSVTANGGLTVYFPERWSEITAQKTDNPTLFTQIINETAFTITSLTDTDLTPRFLAEDKNETFSFDYIIRGRDGHVVSYGEAEGNELRVGANQSVTITPFTQGEIYFPFGWGLLINGGAETPVYLELQPGSSLEISNNDTLRTHTIFVQSEVEFGFDYLLNLDDEISFYVMEDIILPQQAISLPAMSNAVITAGNETLKISIPDVAAITSEVSARNALTKYEIPSGESVYIKNTESNEVIFFLHANEDTLIDYIRYDEDNEIISFGITKALEYFALEENESVLFSSADATIIFPRVFGLTPEPRNGIALRRQTLSHGDVIQIENTDKEQYNRSFLVINETEKESFDFLLSTTRNEVLNYGMGFSRYYSLQANRRVVLAPQQGFEISVAYPAVWHGLNLRVRSVTEQPLFRITLAPGRSMVFHNRSANDYIISNNSSENHAGFHVRGPGEMVRVYDEVHFADPPLFELVPRDIFVPPRPVNLNSDTPETGNIILPAGERITVTAALGENLEIWIPRSWARIMGLIR